MRRGPSTSRPAARRSAPRRRARAAAAGYAAILLLVVLVVGSLYGLLVSMDAATAQLEQRRQDETQQVLRQAKDALIAWSAARPDIPGPNAPGPGHLLCPDLDNDGASTAPITSSCGSAATRTGRLPWKTLGLPDLRDASGERLWYAVSRCFLERSPDLFCDYAVNSDTPGQLAVTGLSPASNVVAIIFAPGAALAGQVRSGAGANVAANYLEGENGDATNDVFETRARCLASDGSCPGGGLPFNDQMIVITHADLFDAAENVVAKRIESEVVPVLNAYYAAWGDTYPYAALFDARPGSSLAGGTWGQLEGLLPIDAPTTWQRWEWCDPTPVSLPWGASLSGAPSPSPPAPSTAYCDVTISYSSAPSPATLRFRMMTRDSGSWPYRGYVGRGFFGRYDEGAKVVRIDQDNAGTSLVSVLSAPAGTTYDGVVAATTNTDGQGFVTFQVRVPASSATVTLRIGPPVVSTALAASTTGALQWYFKNRWHRLTYYRISAGVASGEPGCGGAFPDPCLTVNGVGSGPTSARMALVLAGRALPTQSAVRITLAPPAPPDAPYLRNFFEDPNVEAPAPGDGIFARQPRSNAFNDRLVWVAP